MGYDYCKLSGKIKEIYNTQNAFASDMNLSDRTISLKLNNKLQWKQLEIDTASELLGIKKKDIPEYFFNKTV